MGILNVTKDSFYDGGRYLTETAILEQAERMISDGADFIDVGGYSTRPGAAEIPILEERRRVVDAVTMIKKHFPEAIVSIDSFRSSIAEAAVDAGAAMVNDVSAGGLDTEMFQTVSRLQVPYIAMHMRGTPQTMQSQTDYADLMTEMITYFHQKVEILCQLRVKDVLIDPGFGFSKTIRQNFHVLQNLQLLSILGKPMVVGLSRKSMIWKTLQIDPAAALNGTTALNMVALLKGAGILRVHDVREAYEVIKLFNSLQGV